MYFGRRLIGVSRGIFAAILLLIPIGHVEAQAISRFGLFGDLAYVAAREPQLANVMIDLDRHDLSFAVHIGDLGSPRAGSCTDELWARRLAQFRASTNPMIYTPGDNEWTDCHDKQGVPGGNPLERLVKLRSLFFAGETSLGKRTIPLVRQSRSDSQFGKFRENVRWKVAGVTFITLHVTGSNNGLGRAPEGDAEFVERNAANFAWLKAGFEHARQAQSRGVMILQQANIFPEFTPIAGPPKPNPDGFAELRATLASEALAFGRPVVLVHGDSHYFRIDKPFAARNALEGGPFVPNFTRVEPFGDPHHHWVEGSVEPDNPSVFVFRERLVKENLPSGSK